MNHLAEACYFKCRNGNNPGGKTRKDEKWRGAEEGVLRKL